LLGKTGALLSHNVFAYCNNNPVNRYDPSGHSWLGAVIKRIQANRAKTRGMELLNSKQINKDFSKAEYPATVTDLKTGAEYPAKWQPKYSIQYPEGSDHAESYPADGIEPKRVLRSVMNKVMGTTTRIDTAKLWNSIDQWTKVARPVMITVTDDHGKVRNIAHGWIPFPHRVTHDNFDPDGEMCMYNGFDVNGSEKEQGNAAAIAAYMGIY
jgi:hypothetical protein